LISYSSDFDFDTISISILATRSIILMACKSRASEIEGQAKPVDSDNAQCGQIKIVIIIMIGQVTIIRATKTPCGACVCRPNKMEHAPFKTDNLDSPAKSKSKLRQNALSIRTV